MGEAPSKAALFANRTLDSAWRRGVLPRPVMDADALEEAALRGADPECLGPDAGWRPAFRQLVESLRAEADLNPIGLAIAHGLIVQLLRARIRAIALWTRHPDILERPVAPPIVILGPMRSGTTRLQRLLACDQRLAHTRTFESLHPIPFRSRGLDSRAIRARLALAALERFNPALAAIHPTRPHDPEEEFGLLSMSFGPPQFEAQWRVPAFTRWWEESDKHQLYKEMRKLLQTISWRRGPPPDRPWILKVPQFMEDLPALLSAFPGARLLCLDRDLAQVVPSAASLVWHQMRIQSDNADPRWIGEEWLRKTVRRNRIAAETRRARPDIPQLDLDFAAMDCDWRREMRRIYDFLGLAFTPGLERRMATYLESARAHRGHRYSLDQFGLTPDRLAAHA